MVNIHCEWNHPGRLKKIVGQDACSSQTSKTFMHTLRVPYKQKINITLKL